MVRRWRRKAQRTGLPPLSALRAFDAVARPGGVSAAAAALFVTPGAVTQQPLALEQHVGLDFVERPGRGVVFTDAGLTLRLKTTRHPRAIATPAESLRPQGGVVHVTAVHSVAVRWVVPRPRSFSEAHPDIEALVDASAQPVDLHSGAWDLEIREGRGRLAGLHA